jgi:hypothetical protein
VRQEGEKTGVVESLPSGSHTTPGLIAISALQPGLMALQSGFAVTLPSLVCACLLLWFPCLAGPWCLLET